MNLIDMDKKLQSIICQIFNCNLELKKLSQNKKDSTIFFFIPLARLNYSFD